MLKTIFGIDPAATQPQSHQLAAIDRQLLVDILCNAASMMPFTAAEAKIAAGYMSLRTYRGGEVIIQEGSRIDLDYMLWVLEGEATFEGLTGGGTGQPVTVSVLGAGSALGIMSMVDGEPRSLRGVASISSRCAMLTRVQLKKLCREQPQVGIKLMSALCLIFSQSLRSLTTKFKCHVRLNNVLNEELQELEATSLQSGD